MKKIFYLFILLIFPITVNAEYGIENYRIDITVLENGNLNIKEAFEMNDSYNGFEKIIDYKGNYTEYSGVNLSPTGNNSIYDASGIELKEIRGINSIWGSFDEFKNGDLFSSSSSAVKGDYGIYTRSSRHNGETYLIYNPSSSGKDFYIEYELKNKVIVHNDIAEVGLNIFTDLSENIKNLEVYIHIPNNEEILRIWAHGPLYGETEIVDNETLLLTVKGLDAYDAIDTRFVFDKDIINTNKKSGIKALDKIIEIETKLADEANKVREQYKLKIFIANLCAVILTTILIIYIYITYIKHDKEYKSEFQGKYYRDFPNDYEPSTVGYLINKKISNDDLSASILNLIYKKKIEYSSTTNNKNFILHKVNDTDLTETENKLMKLIFGEKDITSLDDLKKNAKSNYNGFIANYETWRNSSLSTAINHNFFETSSINRLFGVLLAIIVLGISVYIFDITKLSIIPMIISILTIIYMLVFNKRTKQGNEQYAKWNGLKKFMEDFGRMDTKELPEIKLWEKYLVYAVTLGCADKLAKNMKIKINELNAINDETVLIDFIYYDNMLRFNSMLNRNINSTVSTAYSAHAAEIAASSRSSGGGFGGGFSGGGGGFSGGGGGGRF